MARNSPLRYFLGANSKHGFFSLYDGFCPAEEGCFLHVVKGGPGCGKSSFMRKIASAAEERGLEVEYILCSGDPDSLDGIFIPQLRLGYADGTAPHVLEPRFPGSSSAYVDLGRFYAGEALRRKADEIAALNKSYKSLYAMAYRHITAAAAMKDISGYTLWGSFELEKARKKAAGLVKRELQPFSGENGKIRECFMGALSCKGEIRAVDNMADFGGRLCLLDNELGMAYFFLNEILVQSRELGLETIVCRDCVEPDKIEGLIFPDAELSLCCALPGDATEKIYRHIRLDAMADREKLALQRPKLRRSRKLYRECMALAVETLADAKSLHDRLEEIYNPFVDFDGVYAEAEKHISIYL